MKAKRNHRQMASRWIICMFAIALALSSSASMWAAGTPAAQSSALASRSPAHQQDDLSDITGFSAPGYHLDAPDEGTAARMKTLLLYQRATQMYLWTLPAVEMQQYRTANAQAMGGGSDEYKMGYLGGLLKSNVTHLTGNPDSMYIDYFFDTRKGPIVFECPTTLPGFLDDMWQKPVEDIIAATSKQGKYVILPPDWKGSTPAGYVPLTPRTYGSWLLLRGPVDLKTGSTDHAVSEMKKIRIYPLAEFGKPYINRMKYFDLSDKEINRNPPEGFAYFESLNNLVQAEYVRMQDPYILGSLAYIGIEKGKPFQPSPEMKRILTAAEQTGQAMARTIGFDPNYPGKRIWKDRNYFYPFVGSSPSFEVDGKTLLDPAAGYFYFANGTSKLMTTQKAGVGQAYPWTFVDKDGRLFDGGKFYRLHLPAPIPAKDYWSVTVYDNLTRSQLVNGQPFAKFSAFTNPVKNDDGSIDIYFGPKANTGNKRNFVQTVSGKGWLFLLRLYGPDKAYFEGKWKPDDVVEISAPQ